MDIKDIKVGMRFIDTRDKTIFKIVKLSGYKLLENTYSIAHVSNGLNEFSLRIIFLLNNSESLKFL